MRHEVVVSIHASRKTIERLLLRSGNERLAGKAARVFTFDRDDPRLARLRSEIAAASIDSDESEREAREERDLWGAPLLAVRPTATGGYGGLTHFGNTYDFTTGCPACGTGARRSSPLIVRASELRARGHSVWTAQSEFLISPFLAHLLDEERVTGFQLDGVRSVRGDVLKWLHLRPTHTMPRAQAFGGAVDSQCVVCGRDGHYDDAERAFSMRYSEADVDVESLPDIVETWECLGPSRLGQTSDLHMPGAVIAQPHVLAKPRVKEIADRNRIRLRYDPVWIGQTP